MSPRPNAVTTAITIFNHTRGQIGSMTLTRQEGDSVTLNSGALGVSGVNPNYMYAVASATDYVHAVAVTKSNNGLITIPITQSLPSIDLILFDTSNGEDYNRFYQSTSFGPPGAGRALAGAKRAWTVRPLKPGEQPRADVTMQDGPWNIWFGTADNGLPSAVDQIQAALSGFGRRYGNLTPMSADAEADIRVGFGWSLVPYTLGLHGTPPDNWAVVSKPELFGRGNLGHAIALLSEVLYQTVYAGDTSPDSLLTRSDGSLSGAGKNYLCFAVLFPQ